MREIKFRAWRNKKEMIYSDNTYGGYINFFDKCRDFHNGLGGCYLMQFTGLKDKNGKEIFEGDIVQMIIRENIGTFNVPDDIIANGGYTGRDDVYEGKVIYNTNLASFGIDDRENDFVQLNNIEDTFLEIIGNIYENPELLKETNS